MTFDNDDDDDDDDDDDEIVYFTLRRNIKNLVSFTVCCK